MLCALCLEWLAMEEGQEDRVKIGGRERGGTDVGAGLGGQPGS